jgi:antirestriction protein ArdC
VRDSRAKSAFLHITATSRLLSILREDNRAIIRAASQASKAADFLLAFLPEHEGRRISTDTERDAA